MLMQCPICENQKTRKIFFKDDYSFYECVICEHVYVYPMPSKEELKDFYSLEYFKAGQSKGYQEGYENFGELQKNALQKILKNTISLHPDAKNLLDIGCAYGTFLKIAREIGLKAEGIEVSKAAAEYGIKKYSLSIYNGTLDTYYKKNTSARFDIVTMLDVLEHLNEPNEAIKIVSSLLIPAGTLVIKIPNIKSLRARIEGKKWRQIKPPEHLQYFSKTSIEYLLMKHNLKIIMISAIGGIGINLGNNASKKLSKNLLYRAIKLPIVKLAKTIGWLDQLEIYARKI
jgi:2-polyprenyl-3-methyl-5-hydroxy-6-metoxy-1,4-benzoquinol methylase